MKLRFPIDQIRELSKRYIDELGSRDRKLTDAITNSVFPSYKRKGYLTKAEFLTVCAWKTPRSRPRCESNDEEFIKEISRLVKKTASERLRVEAWTLLSGVKWPTASVFLHFAYPGKYPIMDFRALWSVNVPKPSQYSFELWEKYTKFCRSLAEEAAVSMRMLDQALWKYSQLHK